MLPASSRFSARSTKSRSSREFSRSRPFVRKRSNLAALPQAAKAHQFLVLVTHRPSTQCWVPTGFVAVFGLTSRLVLGPDLRRQGIY